MSKQSNVLSFQKAVKQKFNNENEVTFIPDDNDYDTVEFTFEMEVDNDNEDL